jgi:hypothetical protein
MNHVVKNAITIGQHMRSEMHWYNWVIIGLSAFNIYMIYRAYQIQGALNQSLSDNQIAVAMMSAMKNEIENSSMLKDETNEGFVKFLSDSREWAFNYIENTIEVVNKTIDFCNNEIENKKIDEEQKDILNNIINMLLVTVPKNVEENNEI